MNTERLPISLLKRRFVPGRWDLLAFVLVFAALAYLGHAAYGLTRPLSHLESERISLSPWALPGYAAQTALRMLVAMGASLVFTFTYATLAAKSRRAAAVRAGGVVNADVAASALELFDIDGRGLDRLDRRVLDALCRHFAGGPVGLSTLAVAVGEESDTIEDVVEPFLVQQGLLARTPRGRVATRRAYEFFGLNSPERDRLW